MFLDIVAHNFELNIDAVTANKPFKTVVLGDFNISSNLWFKGGDKTSCEGYKIDAKTSQFRLQKLIIEPSPHVASSSSCIGIIFK